MVSDEQLDQFRVNGTPIRVIRDIHEANDVKGIVIAWDQQSVLIRKQNRKVLKLNRSYIYQPASLERPDVSVLKDKEE